MAGGADVTGRVERLRARLLELGAPAILVTASVNVRYLTGFESSNAALLVDGGRALLLTDGRYVDAARAVPGVELVQADRELPVFLRESLRKLTEGPVAFEAEHVSFSSHRTLAGGGVELVPVQGAVERLRAVKDADELDALRRSAALLSEAFELLGRERLVGRTEVEVAWWFERMLRELGAEALAFDTIVASGPNAARPHHHPGRREIGVGETVVVDAGCVVDGYCSDCTRTFATGELAGELGRAYTVCRAAQLASLEALRAGVACRDVDAVARGMLSDAGYEVMHNLGHAVGLEIHEEPRLAKTSKDTVEAGNALTVEPGIYLSGLGGMRIEDLVVVTADGLELLTPITKDLVVVG
ncbi:MAG: aminopeptidase P family protein [Thermoleophilia bacterium]|nr:aminopeptidase P family protein [Thermoleophilia bacterium]